LHAPLESQIMLPEQVSGSAAPVTGAQVPAGVPLQVWQVAQLACSQQTPSTHAPVSHCAPAVHAPPRLWYSQVSAT
jgi:hypothetical protein